MFEVIKQHLCLKPIVIIESLGLRHKQKLPKCATQIQTNNIFNDKTLYDKKSVRKSDLFVKNLIKRIISLKSDGQSKLKAKS
jgi:hypothetical protein